MKYQNLSEKFYEEIFHWHDLYTLPERISKCLLRLYFNKGRCFAIGQQLRNAGTGISLDAENLATLVFRMCQKEYGLTSVEKFQWIEFFPKEMMPDRKDHYSLVNFAWDGLKFSKPDWNKRTYEVIRDLIGMAPPRSLLKDDPFHFTDDEKAGIFALLSRSLESEPIPAKEGGYRKAQASEFQLLYQDDEGLFHFDHEKAKAVLYMTAGGELCIPDQDQKF